MLIAIDSVKTKRPNEPSGTAAVWDGARFHPIDTLSAVTFSGGLQTGVVPNGPNQGYFYVASAGFWMDRSYSLNNWIDNPGPLYSAGMTTWEYVVDAGFDPANFKNKATAHEVGGVTNSHRGRQDAAGSSFESCGNLTQAVERLVAGSAGAVVAQINDARQRAETAVWYASSHVFVNGFQGSPNHVAEWRDALKPDVYDSLTDVTTDTIQAPDPAFCHFSGL